MSGSGAIVLRLIGLKAQLNPGAQLVWSFTIGFGTFGWLLFWLGLAGGFKPVAVTLLCLALCGGLFILDRPKPPNWIGGCPLVTLLGTLLALTFLATAVVALPPPTDSDTLAYHYAIPKLFALKGSLVVIPRALEGMVPLLVQMSYLPAQLLGGSQALTLWTLLSGWLAILVTYWLARQHLSRRWSLALILVFATTPAVINGIGSGQVEIRNATFATAATFAIVKALQCRDARWLVVAGMLAGFYAGTKYLGLIFIAAAATPLIFQVQRWRWLTVFSATAAIAGIQWYAWNWVHTGDPVFPALHGLLVADGNAYWNNEYAASLQKYILEGERGVPVNPLWYFAYPFVATISSLPAFESLRTGFGPYALLLLPFALIGVWRFRYNIKGSPLLSAVIIVLMFYTLWFLFGTSQRVRHLLPVYPIFLILITVAAVRFSERYRMRTVAAAAIVLTLTVQFVGLAIYSASAARYLLDNETDHAFLERNIVGYSSVNWVNQNLNQKHKVIFLERALTYFFDVPSYRVNADLEKLVDIRPYRRDTIEFLGQLKRLNTTHLVVEWHGRFIKGSIEEAVVTPAGLIFADDLDQIKLGYAYEIMVIRLLKHDCAQLVHADKTLRRRSRTLPGLGTRLEIAAVLKLTPERCQLASRMASLPTLG